MWFDAICLLIILLLALMMFLKRKDKTEHPNCHVITRNLMKKYEFKWTVENFSNLPFYEETKSLRFNVEKDSEWWMTVERTYTVTLLTLHQKCSKQNMEFQFSCIVNVVDFNGSQFYSGETNRVTRSSIKSPSNVCSFLIGSNINEVKKAPHETITIILNLKLYRTESEYQFKNFSSNKELEVKKYFMLDVLNELKQVNPDVILRLSEGDIEAHKFLLCARSRVLKNMLQNESKIVDVQGVTLLAMRHLVDFLYYEGSINYNLETAMEVYHAASKYEVLELQKICSKLLASNISRRNALVILKAAEEQNDEVLRDKVLKFIKSKFEDADWWREFIVKETELFKEIVNYIENRN